MERRVTPLEARAALETIERGRLRVIDEIDLPSWYWWGLALGWIGVGFIADLGHPWVTLAATLTFGAVHAASPRASLAAATAAGASASAPASPDPTQRGS